MYSFINICCITSLNWKGLATIQKVFTGHSKNVLTEEKSLFGSLEGKVFIVITSILKKKL